MCHSQSLRQSHVPTFCDPLRHKIPAFVRARKENAYYLVQSPCFSSKAMEADRSEMTCPRTNNPCVAGVGFKPGSSSLTLSICHLLCCTQVLVVNNNELGPQPSRAVKALCFDNIPTLSPPSLKSPVNLPLWEDDKIKSSRPNSRQSTYSEKFFCWTGVQGPICNFSLLS